MDCSLAEDLYSLNDIVAAEQNSFSPSSYQEEEEEGKGNYSDFTREQQAGRGQAGGRRRQEESEVLSTYGEGRRRNS